MVALIAVEGQRIGSPILGYTIPALIFLFSFFIAYYLYKHFTKKLDDEKD